MLLEDQTSTTGNGNPGPSYDPAVLPRIEDIPLPADVVVEDDWSPIMVEMADHIGAAATLRLCEQYGGTILAVSRQTVERLTVLDPTARASLAFIFNGERITIPVASRQILHAKRASVIAAVRAGHLTRAAAAYVLRSPRRHVSKLVNQTDVGVGVDPVVLPERRDIVLLRSASNAIEHVLSEAGIPADLIAKAKARLLATASPLPFPVNA